MYAIGSGDKCEVCGSTYLVQRHHIVHEEESVSNARRI